MNRTLRRLVGPLSTLALAAACVAPALAYDGIQSFTGGAHFYKRVVTNTNVLTGNNEKFEVIPGAKTDIPIPPKTTVLVNVGYSAETRCTSVDVAQNWCEMSITVGGVEASPMASSFGPDTFAVDATDTGNATQGNWRAHAFSRHTCWRNTTDQTMMVPVAVNWKVTNFAGNAPVFWVDDSALVVELARGCSVYNRRDGGDGIDDLAARGGAKSAQQ